MKFRIKQYPRGFVVEYQKKTKWLFFDTFKWYHYVSVSGIEELPWYHSTFDHAMKSLLDKIKFDTIRNSHEN